MSEPTNFKPPATQPNKEKQTMKTTTKNAPAKKMLTQHEFTPQEFEDAQNLAVRLGYGTSTAYTSTSDLIGLHCLVDGPQYARGKRSGCIIATDEFGLLFVQLAEDIEG
jgi:hypothetical protein